MMMMMMMMMTTTTGRRGSRGWYGSVKEGVGMEVIAVRVYCGGGGGVAEQRDTEIKLL